LEGGGEKSDKFVRDGIENISLDFLILDAINDIINAYEQGIIVE
jgi:hypothetical protein